MFHPRQYRAIGLPSLILLILIFTLQPAGIGAQSYVGGTPSPIQQGIQHHLRLSRESPTVEGSSLYWRQLRHFYQNRAFQPVWSGNDGLRPEADHLIESLRQADRQGLDPRDYHLPRIASRLVGSGSDLLAELDLLLTDAFLRYCRDVRSGRADPGRTDPRWHLRATRLDHLATLERALAEQNLAEVLDRLAPQHPWYGRLQQTLEGYRRIAVQGGWPRLRVRKTLRPGMLDPAVTVLRERLHLSGDLPGERTRSEEFDAGLEAAVRRFQARHGLEVDGIVGPRTRAALNVPVEERIGQILVNLERWRWMPRDFESRYILVNAAGFEMHVFEQNRSVLDMKVIVGRAYRQTPTFRQKMTYLDLNPNWNIPKSIAIKDILPKVRKNRAYLARERIRVLSSWGPNAREYDPFRIDWGSIGWHNFPFVLRQDPGPWNALGQIKFMLPNRFNVYLHDTPHRELFESPVRSYSSGCIRLEHPFALAAYLLKDHPEWSRGSGVRDAIESGRRETIYLPEPIQVYLAYWTAWVDEEGVVQFRKDIYGRDRQVQKVLAQKQHLWG